MRGCCAAVVSESEPSVTQTVPTVKQQPVASGGKIFLLWLSTAKLNSPETGF